MRRGMKSFVLVSIILAFFIFNLSGCKGKKEEETQISPQVAQETGEVNTAKSKHREESEPDKELKAGEEKITLQKNKIKSKEEYVFVEKWDEESIGESISPGMICIDSKGFIYVTDAAHGIILKFNSDGKLLFKWGEGEKAKYLWGFGLAVDSKDFVYVTDTYNDRIQKFSSNGEFITKWGEKAWKEDGKFDTPVGIAIDSKGYVYVSDLVNERIQVLRKK